LTYKSSIQPGVRTTRAGASSDSPFDDRYDLSLLAKLAFVFLFTC
jgi:hypothetical protein